MTTYLTIDISGVRDVFNAYARRSFLRIYTFDSLDLPAS